MPKHFKIETIMRFETFLKHSVKSVVKLHLKKYCTNTNFVLKHLFHLTKCRERAIEKTTTFKIKDWCELY